MNLKKMLVFVSLFLFCGSAFSGTIYDTYDYPVTVTPTFESGPPTPPDGKIDVYVDYSWWDNTAQQTVFENTYKYTWNYYIGSQYYLDDVMDAITASVTYGYTSPPATGKFVETISDIILGTKPDHAWSVHGTYTAQDGTASWIPVADTYIETFGVASGDTYYWSMRFTGQPIINPVIDPYLYWGDVNGDGQVDYQDLTNIEDWLPSTTSYPHAGDLNGDNMVTQADWDALDQYLYGGPPVPEPASLALLGLGGLFLVSRRRQ